MTSAASFQTNEAIIARCEVRLRALLGDDGADGPRVASAIFLMGRDLASNSIAPIPGAPELSEEKRKAWAPVIDTLRQIRDECEAAVLFCDERAPADPRQAAEWALFWVKQAYAAPRDGFQRQHRPSSRLRILPSIPDSKIVAFDRKLESIEAAQRSIFSILDEARPVAAEQVTARRRVAMA